uniref:FZ domain-containing protein n=1 Tax=Macrostomum lignano TaxID=282301 RepID=A0A1I8JQP4_9PLAT
VPAAVATTEPSEQRKFILLPPSASGLAAASATGPRGYNVAAATCRGRRATASEAAACAARRELIGQLRPEPLNPAGTWPARAASLPGGLIEGCGTGRPSIPCTLPEPQAMERRADCSGDTVRTFYQRATPASLEGEDTEEPLAPPPPPRLHREHAGIEGTCTQPPPPLSPPLSPAYEPIKRSRELFRRVPRLRRHYNCLQRFTALREACEWRSNACVNYSFCLTQLEAFYSYADSFAKDAATCQCHSTIPTVCSSWRHSGRAAPTIVTRPGGRSCIQLYPKPARTATTAWLSTRTTNGSAAPNQCSAPPIECHLVPPASARHHPDSAMAPAASDPTAGWDPARCEKFARESAPRPHLPVSGVSGSDVCGRQRRHGGLPSAGRCWLEQLASQLGNSTAHASCAIESVDASKLTKSASSGTDCGVCIQPAPSAAVQTDALCVGGGGRAFAGRQSPEARLRECSELGELVCAPKPGREQPPGLYLGLGGSPARLAVLRTAGFQAPADWGRVLAHQRAASDRRRRCLRAGGRQADARRRRRRPGPLARLNDEQRWPRLTFACANLRLLASLVAGRATAVSLEPELAHLRAALLVPVGLVRLRRRRLQSGSDGGGGSTKLSPSSWFQLAAAAASADSKARSGSNQRRYRKRRWSCRWKCRIGSDTVATLALTLCCSAAALLLTLANRDRLRSVLCRMLSEFDNRCATRVELLQVKKLKKQQDARQRNLQSCAAGAAAAAEPPAGSGGALTASRRGLSLCAFRADLAVPNGSYHPRRAGEFQVSPALSSAFEAGVAEWKRSGSNDFNAARLLAKLADFKAKNDFLTQRIRSSMARSGHRFNAASASDASAAVAAAAGPAGTPAGVQGGTGSWDGSCDVAQDSGVAMAT